MKKLLKTLGKFVFSVATFTICMGHPHCLLIIHQPKIPEKLKQLTDKKNEDSNM